MKILVSALLGLVFVAVMASAAAIHHAASTQVASPTRNYRLVAELWSPSRKQWTAAGALPAPRDEHQAIRLDGDRVLVVGGVEGANEDEAALWDPIHGSWSTEQIPPHPTHKGSLMGTGDGRALAIGGWDDVNSRETKAALRDERGKWASLDLPFARTVAASPLASGQILALDGNGHSATFDGRAWAPARDAAPATGGFYGAILLLADGKVLVVQSQLRESFAQIFDPATRAWTAVASLQKHFDARSASPDIAGLLLLSDKRVLILDAMETLIWNEKTDQMTSIPTAVSFESAYALLADDKLMIAGGRDNPTSVKVLDLTTGNCSVTAELQSGRGRATLTALSDGRVLAVGGGDLGWRAAPSSVPGFVLAAFLVLLNLAGAFSLLRSQWLSKGAKLSFCGGIVLGCVVVVLYFLVISVAGMGIRG
jgi:hypothetical protein